MSITASDVSIPTTLSLHDVVQLRQTVAEQREQRALQAGHRIGACPHCGARATIETVTVSRPGHPAVVRIIARCWRKSMAERERCPVATLHEGPAGEPLPAVSEFVPPAVLREPRPCQDCGADISHRGPHAQVCGACAGERRRERVRQYQRDHYRRAERAPETTPEPTQPDPPADDQDATQAPAEALLGALLGERSQAKAEATEPEEESMPQTRPCADCGAPIEATCGRLRCPECKRIFTRERGRLAWHRNNAKQKGLPVPPEAAPLRELAQAAPEIVQAPAPPQQAIEPVEAPQNVQRPVPSALRVSVLTLAQQATDNAGTRALLRDALALSPDRQDLLRRLLDDVEAA